MLKLPLAYATMSVIFLSACLVFNYFINTVLKHSQGFWTDVKAWALFAVPLMFIHSFITLAWRTGKEAGIDGWGVTITATLANALGTTLALWLFFNEPPTAGKLIGLGLVVAGSVVATCYG